MLVPFDAKLVSAGARSLANAASETMVLIVEGKP